MRIGLVGFDTASGLGEVNRQLFQWLAVDHWAVSPHRSFPTLSSEGGGKFVLNPGDVKALRRFINSVDVIIFAERPLYPTLLDECSRRKRPVVCIPMMERLPPRKSWPSHAAIRLFLCPNQACFRLFQAWDLPAVLFPWPADVDRFQFRQRTRCDRFLFINGHGGWNARKGFDVLRKALDRWPEMPLTVCSQATLNLPRRRTLKCVGQVSSSDKLYVAGDALIAPHKADGIGLEFIEAMCCGLPVIATDAEPWNEWPLIGKIRSKRRAKQVRRKGVAWYEPNPVSLVSECRKVLAMDRAQISEWSIGVRGVMEERAWSLRAPDMRRLIETSCF